MMVGMTFQQAMIVGLVLKSSYDNRYGCQQVIIVGLALLRAVICNLFRGPVFIHNHLLVLLTVTPGLLWCDHVAGIKVSKTYPLHISAKNTIVACSP
jgi:hypothetical protein